MEMVGIRDLKTHLSRHLKRVRAGARLLVTDHGRRIAVITPIDERADLSWAHRLVAEGRAHWTGGKPAGCVGRVPVNPHRTVSAAVLEDRR
jgi:prevent-host-death family protein